jgi:hypothetical protein
MTREQIIALQERIGTIPDGFWGPKSKAAAERHLRAMMPDPNPWPTPDDRSMRKFYGNAGDDQMITQIDVQGLGVAYLGKPVKTIRAHEKCAISLRRIIERIADSPHRWILAHYAGAYVNRPMRGGTRPSKHAYGAAIDFWPSKNGLHSYWPTKAEMPIEFMEFFSAEGWTSAGVFWSRDAQHFEATRP